MRCLDCSNKWSSSLLYILLLYQSSVINVYSSWTYIKICKIYMKYKERIMTDILNELIYQGYISLCKWNQSRLFKKISKLIILRWVNTKLLSNHIFYEGDLLGHQVTERIIQRSSYISYSISAIQIYQSKFGF